MNDKKDVDETKHQKVDIKIHVYKNKKVPKLVINECDFEFFAPPQVDIKIPLYKNKDGTYKEVPKLVLNECDFEFFAPPKYDKPTYPNIVHIDYWKCFVPPNRFSVYYSDHTHIDVTHDESELCQKLINCIEKHGGLRGDYDEMYADVFWLLLGLDRVQTDSSMIDAVQFAIGKH